MNLRKWQLITLHKSLVWSEQCFHLPKLLCCRIISSADDVMERSLRLIEEARQALQNPEGQSNAQNLAQVAKDVSQVRWMDRWLDRSMR